MSGAAHRRRQVAGGTSLLPPDMTRDEVDAAPTLASLDALLIDDLSDDEYETFASALDE